MMTEVIIDRETDIRNVIYYYYCEEKWSDIEDTCTLLI